MRRASIRRNGCSAAWWRLSRLSCDMPSDRVVEALLVAELVARNALRYLTGDTAAVSLAPATAASSCAWARSRRAARRPRWTTPTYPS